MLWKGKDEMSKLFEAKLSRLLGSYWSMVASNSSRMAVNHYEERFKIAMDYVNELEAENARLREEMDTIKVAAHMPDDYKYGLPSWVNQVLYANYIGAFISPHITEQIESGHLIFPKAPVYEENARLRDELSVWREDYALLQEENKRLREAS
jgi:hypothetical protein